MQAYICTVCGYLYDEQSAEKTIEGVIVSFEDIDPEWTCPVCGVTQDLFEPTQSSRVPDKLDINK